MNKNGQFVVSGNTKVKVEFPYPNCGKTVIEVFKTDSEQHKDEKAVCECDESYNINITHRLFYTSRFYAILNNPKGIYSNYTISFVMQGGL
jgi:predicted RNA-binding Zn-ribbon protein involved in translation (DUF1610 family)